MLEALIAADDPIIGSVGCDILVVMSTVAGNVDSKTSEGVFIDSMIAGPDISKRNFYA